ncbi:MAG TPA: hypothetical protein VIS49_07620 [Cyclobacteriaceae bacterium]
MKKYHTHLSTALSIVTLFTLLSISGCNSYEPIIKVQVIKLLTAAPWNLSSVDVDGVDQTSVYNGLIITFSDDTFTSSNGGAVWPATGTWVFTDEQATAFERDDGLIVTIQEITETSLKLALTWNETTVGSGRTGSVSGNNVFSFTP